MNRIGLSFVVGLAAVALVAPAAMAAQLHANVLSWTPNDVRPGEPVSIVVQLYTAEGSPYPQDGKPVAGVKDVEVVIRGGGPTRRFATDDVGDGRYRTEIVFPNNGGWDMDVRYGAGSYGLGDEIQLGKGGICVGAPLCEGGPLKPDANTAAPQDESDRVARLVALVAVALGGLAAIALSVVRGGQRRRRLAPDAHGASRPRPTPASDAGASRQTQLAERPEAAFDRNHGHRIPNARSYQDGSRAKLL